MRKYCSCGKPALLGMCWGLWMVPIAVVGAVVLIVVLLL